MTESCWELTVSADAIRLLSRSVSLYLERWPGSDPEEQEALMELKMLLSTMVLETLYDEQLP